MSYKIKSGLAAGDLSTTTAVIAATSGHTYSLKHIVISCSAAAAMTIEDEDGTDLLGPIYLAANGNIEYHFKPGAKNLTISKGVNALNGTDNNACTVFVTVYDLG